MVIHKKASNIAILNVQNLREKCKIDALYMLNKTSLTAERIDGSIA